MPRTLVLTTDLPYFPGRMGVDFFHLRHLARSDAVGLVGPAYPHFPAEGMRNLEAFLTRAAFWPRPAEEVALPEMRPLGGHLRRWVKRLPERIRRSFLARWLGLVGQPADAWLKLAILANCAPQLVAALDAGRWQVAVFIQTGTVPWFDYLPSYLPKLVYFHDVRAHFAARQAEVVGGGAEIAAIAAQERRAASEADVIAFVSELDRQRAEELLAPRALTGLAPIPVDEGYFTPRPADRPRPARPCVLFTGHLAHPPNVDAVTWFLGEIWPRLRAESPEAVCRIVGMFPADAVVAAVAAAGEGVELHPNVPDIRPFFWDAAAFVVPMRFGGGVRQKIFEAWLMRVPVVSTSMGAEGARAESGRNCYLADTTDALVRQLAQLLADGPPETLLAAARATALEHHSIPAAAGQFVRQVQRAAEVKRSRPYRLLFDLRWMRIGHAGGIEQLAFELVDAISRLDRRNEYRLHCPRKTYLEWDFAPGFRQRPSFSDKHESKLESLLSGVVNGLATSLGEPPFWNPAMRALRRWRRMDFDLVHSFNGFIHPDLRAFPSVLTGIDLQHVHLPEFFSAEDRAVRESLYRPSCAAAGHIIPISEYTRQDLHRTYGVPLEKMTTVWIIPSRAAWLPMAPSRARDILAGLGLTPDGYFFFPAHSWPHKNHARLLQAFALALPSLPARLKLVLTGRSFEPTHPAAQFLGEPALRGRVVHLGYRTPLELSALYRGATGLVFPSLFEGFGMPVAEAMIAGCPIACSNTTSLPEIAGEAALLFDPLDLTDIAHSLVALATDDALRAELVAAGERRRGLFSARASAVRTLAIYRRVFEEYFTA